MFSGLCCSRLSLKVPVPSVSMQWSQLVPSLWDAVTWYVAQCSKYGICKEVVEPTFWVVGGEVERRQASHGPCLPEVILIRCRKSGAQKNELLQIGDQRPFRLSILLCSDNEPICNVQTCFWRECLDCFPTELAPFLDQHVVAGSMQQPLALLSVWWPV